MPSCHGINDLNAQPCPQSSAPVITSALLSQGPRNEGINDTNDPQMPSRMHKNADERDSTAIPQEFIVEPLSLPSVATATMRRIPPTAHMASKAPPPFVSLPTWPQAQAQKQDRRLGSCATLGINTTSPTSDPVVPTLMTITESGDEEGNEQNNESILEIDADDERQWFWPDGTPVSSLSALAERHWELVNDFFTGDNAEIVGFDVVLYNLSCEDMRWFVKGYNKNLFCDSMLLVYQEMARVSMNSPRNPELRIKRLTADCLEPQDAELGTT